MPLEEWVTLGDDDVRRADQVPRSPADWLDGAGVVSEGDGYGAGFVAEGPGVRADPFAAERRGSGTGFGRGRPDGAANGRNVESDGSGNVESEGAHDRERRCMATCQGDVAAA